MPFVNSYSYPSALPGGGDRFGGARFRKVVPVSAVSAASSAAGSECLAIGGNVESGDGFVHFSAVATKIGTNGAVSWSKTYSAWEFTDAVAASADGFVLLSTPLYASGGPSSVYQHNLTRIDSLGNVVWARGIVAGNIPGRLIRAPDMPGQPEEFLVILRPMRSAKDSQADSVDLLRFNADGELVGAKKLKGPLSLRIFDAIATADGYLLVGDMDWESLFPDITTAQRAAVIASPERDFTVLADVGLIVGVDRALSTCRSYNFSRLGEVGLSLRAVAPAAQGGFVIVGAAEFDGGVTKVFATNFAAGNAVAPTYLYPLDKAYTRPVAIDAVSQGHLVLIGHRPDELASDTQVLRLDAALSAQARFAFDFSDKSELSGLRTFGGHTVLAGALMEVLPSAAMLLSVDDSFICCRTHALSLPASAKAEAGLFANTCSLGPAAYTPATLDVTARNAPPVVTTACATEAVDVSPDSLVQSPNLNLQAAGSDGSDASRGVLLRWFFGGALAAHLPKGTAAQNSLGFNKPDDFVTIYRAQWPTGAAARRLNFATDRPRYVDTDNRALYFETGAAADIFVVQFPDASGWAAALQAANPMTDPAGFIAAYGPRPFEVELRNVLALACDVTFQAGTGAALNVETRSVAENRPSAAKTTTSRRILAGADGPVARLFAENMRSVRLRLSAAQLQAVAFICYDDVLSDVNARTAWTKLGKFALSTDRTTIFGRLEDPAHFQVDNLWRKFDATARVKVANYQVRWDQPTTGLGAGVQAYLNLSQTDPSATATILGATADDDEIKVSYFDLLQMAGADYQVARMLGLGLVDSKVDQTTSYIHLAEYHTLGDLQDGKGARHVQHLYVSLPTTLAQHRLPMVPDLDGIAYGLSVPTGSGNPYPLTDAQGYTPDLQTRYIKLYPGCRPLYAPELDFFDPPDLFDLSLASLPALYAVEYRKQGQSAWQRPTIAHDTVFLDTSSPAMPEILTTPFPQTQWASGFIHKETDPGIHEYAVRGVNLFSRASPLGIVRATDTTVFKKRNTLLPPNDLQVQYIQPEAPLILTTADEQLRLAPMIQAGGDTTLVRLCCNYGMAQDDAYGFADTIEIFHRQQAPANVTGGVASIGPANDPAFLRIATAPYAFQTTGQTAQPFLAIPTGTAKSPFVGGALVAGGMRFTIEDIQWPSGSTGDNPIFLVRKPVTTGTTADASGNTLAIDDAPLTIYPGDLMMAVENMAAAASWGAGNPLTATIQIGGAPNWMQRTESFTRADGSKVRRELRGIWRTARIEPVALANPNDPKQYKITFANYALTPHPQAQAANPVSWWKGTVRVPVVGRLAEDRRNLAVTLVSSDPVTGDLVLYSVDMSGEAGDIDVTGTPLVNYYPGYRIYLKAEAARNFDAAHLAPAFGEGSRTTLLGLRARDSSTTDDAGEFYRSAMGVPQVLAALEIREPGQPLLPTGLQYATPPDAYGKSSYTLTVQFAAEPFAAVFYRADALSILGAIYNGSGPNSTLDDVRAAILPPDSDLFFTDRFKDFFAYLDNANAAPAGFPGTGGYALPLPDAPSLLLPGGPLSTDDKQKVKAAILNVFVPLTEQPLIYSQISTIADYVPSNRPQNFRDAQGKLLPPAQFDSAPMAKRPAANTIQFVDFTLDGAMNVNTAYFYCVREIGNRMQIGDASPVSAPVKLINLSAAPAPKLRKMTVTPYDLATRTGPSIGFEVIAPSAADPMARLRLYRTSDAGDALSARAMRVIADIDLATLPPTADATLIVSDDFSHDPFVPYGDPLFYRLAWIRDVMYKDVNQVEHHIDAVSEPTRAFLANVIDVINPLPPIPVVTVRAPAPNGEKFVRISWSKTVHNGTYYLSRLSAFNNWMRIGVVKTNDLAPVFDAPDSLPVNGEDNIPIQYRFKIDVAGSAGLINLIEVPVTLSLS